MVLTSPAAPGSRPSKASADKIRICSDRRWPSILGGVGAGSARVMPGTVDRPVASTSPVTRVRTLVQVIVANLVYMSCLMVLATGRAEDTHEVAAQNLFNRRIA